MCWMLIMRKDNSPYEQGDIIEIWDDLPDGETPDVGRRPHMDDEYGSMHSVIHVTGMTKAEAEKYKETPRDITNGLLFSDRMNPNFMPSDVKMRGFTIDIQNKLKAKHRNNLQGKKKKKLSERYDTHAKKPKKNAFDDEMTKAEFLAGIVENPQPTGTPRPMPEGRHPLARNRARLTNEGIPLDRAI